VRCDFLHKTFLFDRETTIAEYLSKNADIMDEIPPESLNQRYNG